MSPIASRFGARSTALEVVQDVDLRGKPEGVPADVTNRVSGYSPHIMDHEGAMRLWALSETMLAAA